jgi:NAD-dependent deacetylase
VAAIPDRYANLIDQAASLLRHARYAIALTGAGISTPSGIPDFRSPHSGLWQNTDPKVASLYGFRHNPQSFFDWIRPLAKVMCDAQPNSAHLALARMEALDVIRVVITQNIDILHTRAGTNHILELHGHIRTATCGSCFRSIQSELFLGEFLETGNIPRCPHCSGILKPDVILFGEQLPMKVLREAEQAARECDVMLIAGSSLSVAPVSEFPLIALAHGAKVIVANFEETYIDPQASVIIRDDVASVLPCLVKYLEG